MICKYCESKTPNQDGICRRCKELIVMIRQIKAMLMPYYRSKKAREKLNK